MTQEILAAVAKQRHALSAALVVALFLVLVGHIPVLPVFAGCLFAVAISVLRVKWPEFGRRSPGRAR